MAYPYNVNDWYWKVGDTNPTTHRFSSASGSYVVLADATYTAWVAAGNVATVIDTQADLYIVINQAALDNLPNLWGSQSISGSGGTHTLTNPLPTLTIIANTSGGLFFAVLPQANMPNGMPIGEPFYIRNSASSTGVMAVNPSGGAGIATVNPGDEVRIIKTSNSTVAGTYDAAISPSLPVKATDGGTGWNGALTSHGILIGNNNSAIHITAAMTDGQLLVGQTGADPLPKTISGDVTFAASGAVTIANDAVTYAKMQNVSATDKLLGRSTAGAGDVEEIDIGAWSTYTPTVSAQTGTITTASATGRYKQIGKTVTLEVDVTITTAGTGADNLQVTLPVTAAGNNYVGSSAEVALSGKGGWTFIAGGLFADTTHARARDATFTTYIANGARVLMGITYEAA